eukprot:41026-Eustigmatos_ZCMA.PRE.1
MISVIESILESVHPIFQLSVARDIRLVFILVHMIIPLFGAGRGASLPHAILTAIGVCLALDGRGVQAAPGT